MSDFKDLSKSMKQLGKDIPRNADRTIRKVALAVDATIVLATPVDTGRARSNWQVSLNNPAANTIGPYSPGEKRSTEGANSRAALEQGKSVISQYNGNVDSSINITNNLSYIGALNDGFSAQAPEGFVEKAIMVGVNAINKNGNIVVNNGGAP